MSTCAIYHRCLGGTLGNMPHINQCQTYFICNHPWFWVGYNVNYSNQHTLWVPAHPSPRPLFTPIKLMLIDLRRLRSTNRSSVSGHMYEQLGIHMNQNDPANMKI